MIEQDEVKRLEEKVQHLQQTLEISKAQYNLENSILREQIKKLSAGKDVTEILDQNLQLQQEKAAIKESLLKYWVSVTKTLNDDFEEILQLGIDTDIVDIVNALLMVEDARQEQMKSDKDTINELREINQNLQHRVDQFDSKPQVQSEEPSHEQENKDLAKQLRDLSHLMIEQNRNLELKDFKIQELQQQIQQLTPEFRNLEIQINELTLKLVQVKEEKLSCMQQAQEQQQQMKEKELDLQRQLQYYQMKYSRHDETPENKKGSRNSMDGMNFQQQHHEEERQSSLNRVQQQNGSPFLSKFKPIPSGQQAELSRSVLMNKKMELVQGSSQPQQPYKFGK